MVAYRGVVLLEVVLMISLTICNVEMVVMRWFLDVDTVVRSG